MLQRFPCSTVIFFVCISRFLEYLFFPSHLLLLSEPSARGLSAHCKGICQESQRQGFQEDFSGTGKISQKLSLTLAMLPDAKLRAYKPGRTDSEGEKSIEIQKL